MVLKSLDRKLDYIDKREGECMDEKSRELLNKIIFQSKVEVEGYVQLSEFDNVILACREDVESLSGLSFLILQKDTSGKTVFRRIAEEFQNANTLFCMRAALSLKKAIE